MTLAGNDAAGASKSDRNDKHHLSPSELSRTRNGVPPRNQEHQELQATQPATKDAFTQLSAHRLPKGYHEAHLRLTLHIPSCHSSHVAQALAATQHVPRGDTEMLSAI